MATDFSGNTVSKNIISQAVPLIMAQIVQMLYNVVDRVYIGHLPGSDGLALTGIGLSFPIVTLIMAFTQLLGAGGTPLFSMSGRRRAGKEDHGKRLLNAAWVFRCFVCILLLFSKADSVFIRRK